MYSAHVFEPSFGQNEDTRTQIQTQLENFILHFRHDNDYVYRYATSCVELYNRTDISDLLRIETN